MSTLKAVLFDLDGTVLLDARSPVEQFLLFCQRLGHACNGDTARRLERWQHEYWATRQQVEADLTEHGQEKFWLAYNVRQLEFVGMAGPLDDHARKIDSWFRDEYVSTPLVPDDVRPTLTYLRDLGLTLGLVSNRTTALAALAAENGLDHLFHFTLSAGEAASWKPDPGIFNQAVQRAAATPQTCAYVGDNYFADVLGARGAGLVPILVDRRNIFPEADCRIIKSIGELRDCLPHMSP
jgi:putative hydrolase of the HAD superfamily